MGLGVESVGSLCSMVPPRLTVVSSGRSKLKVVRVGFSRVLVALTDVSVELILMMVRMRRTRMARMGLRFFCGFCCMII